MGFLIIAAVLYCDYAFHNVEFLAWFTNLNEFLPADLPLFTDISAV